VEPVQVEGDARGSMAVPIIKARKIIVEIRILFSLFIFVLAKTSQSGKEERLMKR
jgi:hypothetical protein